MASGEGSRSGDSKRQFHATRRAGKTEGCLCRTRDEIESRRREEQAAFKRTLKKKN